MDGREEEPNDLEGIRWRLACCGRGVTVAGINEDGGRGSGGIIPQEGDSLY